MSDVCYLQPEADELYRRTALEECEAVYATNTKKRDNTLIRSAVAASMGRRQATRCWASLLSVCGAGVLLDVLLAPVAVLFGVDVEVDDSRTQPIPPAT